jgi:hypothetical protein
MSYEIYKVTHILGLLMLFAGLAALWGAQVTGASSKGLNRSLGMLHGVGLLFLLISGFGMIARLGLMSSGLPGWIYVKLGLWLALGAAAAVVKRKASLLGMPLLCTLIAAGALAAYMAIVKPF